MNESH